ncbi:transcriptional regulator Myc-A-like [Limulus polyphemus]|uniref:Transcriptional regulator Myc-A-like n=1 Tax=Limulus polyphemus TaxID=6850 RepID=A0ABM1C0A4_LIMPO|nr:transcriptional regulator Myc-A-like [Limulus polyphemus]XP_022235583.1 transcriptional regulator Myc-A-like [Limulus polyphemus]
MPSLVDTGFSVNKGISALGEDDFSCSFGEIEEFYNTSTPSEDIWKKFDLLTPPLSPDRKIAHDYRLPFKYDQSLSFEEEFDCKPSYLNLGLYSNCTWLGLHSDFAQVKQKKGLKAEVRHDCMWSGQCSGSCVYKSDNADHSNVSTKASVGQADLSRTRETISLDRGNQPSTPLEEVASDCVDPSTVLSCSVGFFLTDHSYFQATKKDPPLSSKQNSDAQSDSDEEIDVVSVEGTAHLTTHIRRPRNLACPIRKGLATQPMKRPASPDSASSDSGFSCSSVAPVNSKKKFRMSGSVVRSSRPVPHSRSSSDSEDPVRRKEHNSMERKRRDDLRLAFQTLREQVPDLSDNPKAPKVAILKRAALFANQLSSNEQRLERTLQAHIQRRNELQRRLHRLQKACLARTKK